MCHVLPVLCIGHSHACPSMVVVMIGLNTQVGLVLTINCYLLQTCFDRPLASYGTKVVLFGDHLQQNQKQVHYYHCIENNIQSQVPGFDGCPINLDSPIILGVFWGTSLQDLCFHVLLLSLS